MSLIFQIKADHYANDTHPIMTLSLDTKNGLYIEKHEEQGAHNQDLPIKPLDDIRARWIQVRTDEIGTFRMDC